MPTAQEILDEIRERKKTGEKPPVDHELRRRLGLPPRPDSKPLNKPPPGGITGDTMQSPSDGSPPLTAGRLGYFGVSKEEVAMSEVRRIILLAMAACVALMLMFPPYAEARLPVFSGFHLITDPPRDAEIMLGQLLVQWVGVMLVGGLLWFAVEGDGKEEEGPHISQSGWDNRGRGADE